MPVALKSQFYCTFFIFVYRRLDAVRASFVFFFIFPDAVLLILVSFFCANFAHALRIDWGICMSHQSTVWPRICQPTCCVCVLCLSRTVSVALRLIPINTSKQTHLPRHYQTKGADFTTIYTRLRFRSVCHVFDLIKTFIVRMYVFIYFFLFVVICWIEAVFTLSFMQSNY